MEKVQRASAVSVGGNYGGEHIGVILFVLKVNSAVIFICEHTSHEGLLPNLWRSLKFPHSKPFKSIDSCFIHRIRLSLSRFPKLRSRLV